MPEGPEIAQYSDKLRSAIQGWNLQSIDFLSGRYVEEDGYDTKKNKSLPKNTNVLTRWTFKMSPFVKFDNDLVIDYVRHHDSIRGIEECKLDRNRLNIILLLPH